MHIKSLSCVVCKSDFSYPDKSRRHKHPELDIGGVPSNIWIPMYDLPKDDGIVISERKGILKFDRYFPFNTSRAVSWNEGSTPLIHLEGTPRPYQLFLKDEGKNPTGSFKDRGMPLLVLDACNSGKKAVAIPSTGNAALSLSHYAGLAGLETILFVPKKTPKDKELQERGATTVVFCDDLIQAYEAFFRHCEQNPDIYNGFPVTNLFYSQGLKTMAYEIYLDMDRTTPDWLVAPCGSGGNVVSQYMGFVDLFKMGLIKRLPRFVTVQIEGADPITVGHREKKKDIVILRDIPQSRADAIASDTSFNYHKILDTLDYTGGIALSVTDNDIEKAVDEFSEEPYLKENKFEFSSLSVFAALKKLERNVKPDEKVVVIGTARSK